MYSLLLVIRSIIYLNNYTINEIKIYLRSWKDRGFVLITCSKTKKENKHNKLARERERERESIDCKLLSFTFLCISCIKSQNLYL